MPAAAVIPAPIAYMKVVAVKKLVVGFRIVWDVVDRNGLYCAYISFLGEKSGQFQGIQQWVSWGCLLLIVYFEKIRVFKAGVTQP